jgi:uncharacterized membrane protein
MTLPDDFARPDVILLIIAIAAVTYLTRIGGHLVLSRFSYIPPRVEAALDAVPAAVITAIIVAPVINGGIAEWLAVTATALAALRLPSAAVLVVGFAVLLTARAVL